MSDVSNPGENNSKHNQLRARRNIPAKRVLKPNKDSYVPKSAQHFDMYENCEKYPQWRLAFLSVTIGGKVEHLVPSWIGGPITNRNSERLWVSLGRLSKTQQPTNDISKKPFRTLRVQDWSIQAQ